MLPFPIKIKDTPESARIIEPSMQEVGPHNPRLLKQFLNNPVNTWVGLHITAHQRHPTPKFHLDVCDELVFGKQDVVFKAARSLAKSTTIENFLTYMACEYGRLVQMKDPPVYPFKKIMYVTSTGTKAEEVNYNIRLQLEENELILAEYGDLRGKKWTDRLLITRDGFQIKFAGRGAQVRGFRPGLFIGDDLEDDEEVRTDEQMDKTKKWIDTAVLNTLDEIECRAFWLGTVLHPDAAINYVADKPGVAVKEYPAYVDPDDRRSGTEQWPSKWPHWRLEERRKKIGNKAFEQEFMLKPKISDNPIFDLPWFKHYEPESDGFKKLCFDGVWSVTCCDPATSKKDKTDYTALVTISATFEGKPRIFIRTGIGTRQGHWPCATIVVNIFNAQEHYGLNEVGIETTAFQQVLADEFRSHVENNRQYCNLRELIPSKDKETRANSVSPIVQRGQVYYDPNDADSKKLVDQCVNFQPGVTNIKKDLMDAFIYCLILFMQWMVRRKTGEIESHLEGMYGTDGARNV